MTDLETRDRQIFQEYQSGERVPALAARYCLDRQRIYQILRTVSRQTGEALKKKPVGLIPKVRRVDAGLLERIFRRELTVKQASKLHKIPATALSAEFKRVFGASVQDVVEDEADCSNRPLYDEFMNGSSLIELADKYNSNVPAIARRIYRYRTKYQLPAKRPWLKLKRG